jgi:hypothetical protein
VEGTKQPRTTHSVIEFVKHKLGPAPLVVEVGCVLSTDIGDSANVQVICFDPTKSGTNKNLRFIPTLMWNRTDSYGINGSLVQARPLDYYWEEYRFPIDLLICNPKEYARVILGGRRIIFESRYLAVRTTDSASQIGILKAMLPDFEKVAGFPGYSVHKNTTF